jgi:hypothetical protein
MSVADKAANVPRRKLRFRRLESAFAICRLPPRSTIPSWFPARPFTSVTRTNDEASLVCPFESVPEGVQREHPFVTFKLLGPFAFSETGILASFIRPMADRKDSGFCHWLPMTLTMF